MKPKILYIDDEPQNLISLKASLREEFNIVLANSAIDGLALLESEPDNSISIIISDQRMPGMNGDEFFTHIPKSHQHATRILLTAYADIDAAKQALNRGRISFFYNKPYDEDEFVKALNQGCRLFERKVQLESEVERTKNISKLQIQKLVMGYEESSDVFSEELHEEFAQKLTGLKLFLHTLELSKGTSDFSNLINRINQILGETITSVQDICFKVMPRSLKLGLKETLFELIQKFQKMTNITVRIVECDLPELSVASNLFIYRIFKEILEEFSGLSTKPTNLNVTIKDNLLITFNSIAIVKNWEIEEHLVSKIEAYNGKITRKEGQLELLFDPFS